MTKNFWKKSALSKVKILNISGGEKKTGRAWHYRKKNLKKPYFSGETKKTWHYRSFFVHLENFFFSPPEILSILHAWHYRKNLVIFLEKFMIFWKKTKKFFFNVNPYHFWNSCVTLQTQKKIFLKGYLPTSCVFFSPKKKKNFFFPGPKILKKPCEEPTKWSKNHHFAGFFISLKTKISSEH